MKTLPIVTSRCTGRRILLIAVGVVALALGVDQLAWQRWLLAAIQGSLGVGAALAGVWLPDATLMGKTFGDIVKTVLATAALVAGLVMVALSAGRTAVDFIGLLLPYLSALWLLAVGARFARRRISRMLVAFAAGLLLVLQCAIFGLGILLSAYNFQARTQSQVLLGAVAATGFALLWWFIRFKLSRGGPRQPPRDPHLGPPPA